MIDAERFPADEIRKLYHEGWEIDLGYAEIEMELLDNQQTTRSKNAEGVAQEIGAQPASCDRRRSLLARAARAVDEGLHHHERALDEDSGPPRSTAGAGAPRAPSPERVSNRE